MGGIFSSKLKTKTFRPNFIMEGKLFDVVILWSDGKIEQLILQNGVGRHRILKLFEYHQPITVVYHKKTKEIEMVYDFIDHTWINLTGVRK